MGNTNAEMAEFADNLWNNYIKPKVNEMLRNYLSYYKAKVTANPGDGRLKVRRPFDREITVRCTEMLRSVKTGTQVIVVRFGTGTSENHIAMLSGSDTNIIPLIEEYIAKA